MENFINFFSNLLQDVPGLESDESAHRGALHTHPHHDRQDTLGPEHWLQSDSEKTLHITTCSQGLFKHDAF